MGRPMAENLLRAGFSVVVHSRSPRPVDALVSQGARAAVSPATLASTVDIVVTMLPDTADVEEVICGRDGVIHGLATGSLVIDMSTIDPAAARDISRRVEAKGASFVDAPVSG